MYTLYLLISCRKIVDFSKLILSVDLFDITGTREDNCVRHGASAPSISASTTIAYPVMTQPMRNPQTLVPHDATNLASVRRYPLSQPTTTSIPSSPYEQRKGLQSFNNDPRYNGHYQNGYDGDYHRRGSNQEPMASPGGPHPQPLPEMYPATPVRVEPSKNLIGQCHTTVQKLKGQDGKTGLFFIFQDLSVRTEGWFRLKCSLFALGGLGFEGDEGHVAGTGLLDEGPCLATAFSKPLKVFSAKKFPGVVETTELSQIFAKQGIKIPIRNGEKGKSKRSAQDEALDQEEDNFEDDDS